jgi:hypothetical protein
MKNDLSDELDFELPVVESTLVIHRREANVCIACEG